MYSKGKYCVVIKISICAKECLIQKKNLPTLILPQYYVRKLISAHRSRIPKLRGLKL